MLTLSAAQRDAMVACCIRALPDEGCGVLLGTPDGTVVDVIASANVAQSAKLYEIESRVLLMAYRRAEEEDLVVMGVFHSHTHSGAYPSPTDVALAPDPLWHYVLVSLLDVPIVVKSYAVKGESVVEEPLNVLV
jgi:proteasome lid subunit RPN8/RPN11